MKKTLLILTALFISVIGYSQTFNASDNNSNILEFNVTSATTVEVTDYVSGGTDIDIPLTVTNNGTTYNITGIGNLAFLNNGLTSVIIPNGVINIGLAAFQQNMLTNVAIPNSVTSIELNAFRINQLTSITIPNNVSSIAAGAFFDNPLTCVISENTIPPTVGIQAGGNTNLDSFGGSRVNINLSIPSGTAAAYTAAQWTGFNSVAEGLTGTFVIDNITYQINATPNNEVTITDYNTAGGTVVNIPATVNSGCTDFSVTDIGNNALRSKGLTMVNIPNSVTTIGNGSFQQNSLTNVVIPNSVTQMLTYAFANNSLTSVTLSNSLTSITTGTFEANSLISVTIPDGVTSIGTGAFKTNALENLVLPNTLLTISLQAFRTNALTSITIPANVTTIGNTAFGGNPLTTVISQNTIPPTITTVGFNDSFASDRSDIDLIIPTGTEGPYVTDTGALWTDFKTVNGVVLSISDFELANDIKIITTTDAIKVTASNTIRLQNYAVYSITGAKVATGKESEISTSTFANGIYILKLDFDKGTITKKVILN